MLFSRKEFIKISALAGISALLNSCGINTEDDKGKLSNKRDSVKTRKPFIVYKKSDSDNVLYITGKDDDYESLRNGFNKRINKSPAVIALCLNVAGVQEAVAFAKENKLKVAIKSGGHCFEGFSANNNGLTINLSKLNALEFKNKDIIEVGPACKLGDLYQHLHLKNRILPAGSCSGVGIGGLTLGGGYGFFSRKYGLTCDSIIELEMVNAEGEILNSKQHPELLWALKGAGNGNFGVITKFCFKTYKAPAFFQSNRFKAFHLDAVRAHTILKCWFGIAEKLPVHCFSAFVLNGRRLTILLTNYEVLPLETEALLNELALLTDSYKKGGKSTLKAALKIFGGQTAPVLFKNASVGLYRDFEDIKDIIPDVIEKVISGKGLIYQVNTIGGNISNEKFARESCFPHRACLFLSELQSYWLDESKTDFFMNQFADVQSLFFNAGINKQYVNYPSLNNPSYEIAYYGENYERLKNVKKMYDPGNLFCHDQSINIG